MGVPYTAKKIEMTVLPRAGQPAERSVAPTVTMSGIASAASEKIAQDFGSRRKLSEPARGGLVQDGADQRGGFGRGQVIGMDIAGRGHLALEDFGADGVGWGEEAVPDITVRFGRWRVGEACGLKRGDGRRDIGRGPDAEAERQAEIGADGVVKGLGGGRNGGGKGEHCRKGGGGQAA